VASAVELAAFEIPHAPPGQVGAALVDVAMASVLQIARYQSSPLLSVEDALKVTLSLSLVGVVLSLAGV